MHVVDVGHDRILVHCINVADMHLMCPKCRVIYEKFDI